MHDRESTEVATRRCVALLRRYRPGEPEQAATKRVARMIAIEPMF
jgi:hypothetical protein